jgi:choline kinase
MSIRADQYRVVILSAGQGSRLLPHTEHTPKCLLDIGGRTMLAWQLYALAEVGVCEAVVVTGFREDLVRKEVESHAPRTLRTRTLFNPFFHVADNLASCWMARAELTGPCLILNGDTLFEPEIARRLMAAPPSPITVTIDRKPAYDDDDMKVHTEHDRLTAIGKTLPAGDVTGESIGFLRFDAVGASHFVAELERALRTPEGTGQWYLSAIHRLASNGVQVQIASIEGLQWAELDFPGDLEQSRAMVARWTTPHRVRDADVGFSGAVALQLAPSRSA